MRLFASAHASKPVFPVHKRNAFAKLTHETHLLHAFTLTAKRVCYKCKTDLLGMLNAFSVNAKRILIYTLRLTGTVHLCLGVTKCVHTFCVSIIGLVKTKPNFMLLVEV